MRYPINACLFRCFLYSIIIFLYFYFLHLILLLLQIQLIALTTKFQTSTIIFNNNIIFGITEGEACDLIAVYQITNITNLVNMI